MNELTKELRECKCHCSACKENIETLSRHEQEEPLAALAYRKGVSIEITPPSFYVKSGELWEVGVAEPSKGLFSPFEAPTYIECEAKARQYLMGLEDKHNG